VTLALLFPGQGSQVVGMGRALAAEFSPAAETLAEADDVLGFALSRLMAEGPEAELTATRNAQPALLTHSVAVHRVIAKELGPVAFAAGHSLGEFSAHVAAGTLSFRDALGAVWTRGRLMYESGLERPGAMAAVLGLGDSVVEEVCDGVQTGICVPANFNSPGQVVVSGDVAGVEEGMARARDAGAKRTVPLNVSGAFHSPLMEPAAHGLREKLDALPFGNPSFPVVANVNASPVASGEEARRMLVEQLTSPVRWSSCIATMIDAGVDRFVELGPGSVLCGLNKRNARGLPCVALGEPRQLEAFLT
jgi:[acyl-carrier-protein] S-malonyltransferase